MAEGMKFETGQPRTSAPILMSTEDASVIEGAAATIHSVDGHGSDFSVPFKKGLGETKSLEFILMVPGTYSVSWARSQQIFTVQEQRNVSFFTELGVLSFLVLSILGGLIVWSRNKKKSASFGAGPS